MSENRQRNHVLTVRVDDDEREQWATFAKARGLTLAGLVRLSVESTMIQEAIHDVSR